MKKIIATVISLILIILSCTNVFAMKTVPAYLQVRGKNEQKPIERENIEAVGSTYDTHLFKIDGETYIYDGRNPRKYDAEQELELKSKFPEQERCIITDDGYYTTYTVYIDHPVRGISTLELYDKEFNLIKERMIDCVYDIGYVDGLYYVSYNGHVEVSSDFENWTEIEGDMPKHNFENTITIKDDTVKFSPNENFTEVSYEDRISTKYDSIFGDRFVKYDDEGNMYLTKDNVYFINIEYDKEEHSRYSSYDYFDVEYCYDDGDNILIQDSSNNRLVVPKSELYNALNELEEVPYVRLGDKILGFSQPPVMESDRILVPMRFLFEQMGATVDWNNDTQSAIATIGEEGQEKRVEFSIDNTTALVNGKPETTDVPARLINDQTFVPLRFLSENLGYNVEWDDGARTAVITTE